MTTATHNQEFTNMINTVPNNQLMLLIASHWCQQHQNWV